MHGEPRGRLLGVGQLESTEHVGAPEQIGKARKGEKGAHRIRQNKQHVAIQDVPLPVELRHDEALHREYEGRQQQHETGYARHAEAGNDKHLEKQQHETGHEEQKLQGGDATEHEVRREQQGERDDGYRAGDTEARAGDLEEEGHESHKNEQARECAAGNHRHDAVGGVGRELRNPRCLHPELPVQLIKGGWRAGGNAVALHLAGGQREQFPLLGDGGLHLHGRAAGLCFLLQAGEFFTGDDSPLSADTRLERPDVGIHHCERDRPRIAVFLREGGHLGAHRAHRLLAGRLLPAAGALKHRRRGTHGSPGGHVDTIGRHRYDRPGGPADSCPLRAHTHVGHGFDVGEGSDARGDLEGGVHPAAERVDVENHEGDAVCAGALETTADVDCEGTIYGAVYRHNVCIGLGHLRWVRGGVALLGGSRCERNDEQPQAN